MQVELAAAEAQLRGQEEDRAAMEARLQSLEKQVLYCATRVLGWRVEGID